MDLRKLKKLIDLVQESGISELEITEGEEKVKIVKGGAVAMLAAAPTLVAPAPTQVPVGAAGTPATAPAAEPAAGQEGHVVKAPMVGTFYRSPSPDAKPFVEVGEVVRKGQVVSIVEAMKLMNEIEAEADGKIVEILAKNGEHVEYGQSLIRLAKG